MTWSLLLIFAAVAIGGPRDVGHLVLVGVSLAVTGLLCAVVESEVRK